MRDKYEMFNHMELELPEEITPMDDLEKQRFKRRLKKQVKKPGNAAKKLGIAVCCAVLFAGIAFTEPGEAMIREVKAQAEAHFRSVTYWLRGINPEEHITKIMKSGTVDGRTVKLLEAVADEDLITISFEQIISEEMWEEEEKHIGMGVGILEGELYADGELVGTGAIDFYTHYSDTDEVSGKFQIVSRGMDFSKLTEAELVLYQTYENGERTGEEGVFPITFTGKNLKASTENEKIRGTFQQADGRNYEAFRYAENESYLKIYTRVTYPEGWSANKVSTFLELEGISAEGRRVAFRSAGGYTEEDGTEVCIFLTENTLLSANGELEIRPFEVERIQMDYKKAGEPFSIRRTFEKK